MHEGAPRLYMTGNNAEKFYMSKESLIPCSITTDTYPHPEDSSTTVKFCTPENLKYLIVYTSTPGIHCEAYCDAIVIIPHIKQFSRTGKNVQPRVLLPNWIQDDCVGQVRQVAENDAHYDQDRCEWSNVPPTIFLREEGMFSFAAGRVWLNLGACFRGPSDSLRGEIGTLLPRHAWNTVTLELIAVAALAGDV